MKKIIDESLSEFCNHMIPDLKLKNGIKCCLGLEKDGNAKRLRPLLCLAVTSDTSQEKISKQAIQTACSIEMLHCASLVLDDLQDNCETRRGLTSAWKKFGVAKSLMICHTMVAFSFQLMDEKFLKDFVEAYFQMCLGQSSDLIQGKKTTRLYEKIVSQKTGALFSFALKVGAQSNKSDSQIVNLLSELGYLFGFLYQIKDDLNDEDWKISEKDMRNRITTVKDSAIQLLGQYETNFGQKRLFLPQIFKKNLSL